MFIRKLKNRSGSISVQIISKNRGKYKVVKTIGTSKFLEEIPKLEEIAKQEIKLIKAQEELFISENDNLVEKIFSNLENASIRTVGPELIFGKIYDSIGFSQIKEELFRHLVISRLAFPLSKLKTIEYLYRYRGIQLDIDAVYRFLDKLSYSLKEEVEQIAFNHTLKTLEGKISVVFYDMTTIYFESSDEDELRQSGFSKDGKHRSPQIYLGLLVGIGGYAIAYDIYQGSLYEGHSLIPFIEKARKKFNIGKPIVIADSGLLSSENIKSLEQLNYEYIIGGRIKNETEKIKNQITKKQFIDGQTISIKKDDKIRLVINYSSKRAYKDKQNRERGLNRLEKQINNGKLTKSNINNRGYNKYLKMDGEVIIKIDYEKFNNDNKWDGLKGYITNSKLTQTQVIENYKNLWHIEKAFRISKTDLRIRPIYHRLKNRIQAHICIAFSAYCIYKELERVLYKENSTISVKEASELTHNIYQINFLLPESKKYISKLLKMDEKQAELYNIIKKYF